MSTQPEERSRFAHTCPGCGSFHAPRFCNLLNRDDENAALRAEGEELRRRFAELERRLAALEAMR